MKSFVLICAICLQLGWSHAKGGYSNGAGAFSYQDSSGNRYGGTYGLKDGEVVDTKGTFPPDFSPPDFSPPDFSTSDFSPPTFQDPDDFTGFYSEYFRNLENLLQDPGFAYNLPTAPTYYPYLSPKPEYNSIPNYGGSAYNDIPDYTTPAFSYPNYNYLNYNLNRAFQANLDSRKLALDAAHKAFDLTSNQAGFIPNLNPSRFTPFNDNSGQLGASGFPDMPNIPQFPHGFPFEGGIPMPSFGNAANGAYAGAAVGPGYNHQVAAVNPSNPLSPNINTKNRGSGNPGGYKSVSVSSYSSSSNVNGRKMQTQGAETMVNDNGVISTYSVHNP